VIVKKILKSKYIGNFLIDKNIGSFYKPPFFAGLKENSWKPRKRNPRIETIYLTFVEKRWIRG